MPRLCDFSPPSAVILVQCHCEASARTGCGNPSPIPSAPLPKGGWHGEAVTGGFFSAPHLLLRSVGAGFSCPPSCQPIPGHCCGRQSGHFLETASLLLPPAALRRFPRPREGQSPSPTHPEIRFRRGRCLHRPEPSFPTLPGRAHGPCPTKIPCRAAPMCAALHRTSVKRNVIAGAQTARGNPSPSLMPSKNQRQTWLCRACL